MPYLAVVHAIPGCCTDHTWELVLDKYTCLLPPSYWAELLRGMRHFYISTLIRDYSVNRKSAD